MNNGEVQRMRFNTGREGRGMGTSRVGKWLALGTGGALIAIATGVPASAATPASSTNPAPTGLDQPPAGPDAEQVTPLTPYGTTVREGLEGAVGIGTGFSDTYGVGLEARVGYTFRGGIYAGGAVEYYQGHSLDTESAHATFVGGEVGYRIFATRQLEIRPYVFGGPAFVTQIQSVPFFVDSGTSFAIQPGGLVTYHFGRAFVGGDARWLVTPNPATLAILASGGIGF
jgi:hypothetical protein